MMNSMLLWICQFCSKYVCISNFFLCTYDNIFFMYKRCNKLKLPIVDEHVILNPICKFLILCLEFLTYKIYFFPLQGGDEVYKE
jgi:hypothetical protein